MKKEKDWFKLKKYPHIGLPLKAKDREKWIEQYITNSEAITKHRFLPFIHKTYKQRKYRKAYFTQNGERIPSIKNNNSELEFSRYKAHKDREIFYASHLDALIYTYYAQCLANNYESKLKEVKLENSITAYRSVPINEDYPIGPNKCNIDFAVDVFTEILKYREGSCVVMAFDISSFFDNLDHVILLKMWMEMMDVDRLPSDHFNVFKNITRFSYVDQAEIFEHFKNKIIVERNDPNTGKKIQIKKKVAKIKFLKNQRAIAYCTKSEFLKKENKQKLIHQYGKKEKRNKFGIPQGSPISSVLANIYLFHFDRVINDIVRAVGGIYRRYSDDMVIICPQEYKAVFESLIYIEIEKFKLEIKKAKTQIFYFRNLYGKFSCGQEFTHSINFNKNFIYLGLEFDGQNVLLKSASISGYYRKMKRSIRRHKYFSNKYRKPIFKRRILKKFSYKGSKRYRKYKWNSQLKEFEKSNEYNWGNFLSYAKKAERISITNKIYFQTKSHWKKLEKLINESQRTTY